MNPCTHAPQRRSEVPEPATVPSTPARRLGIGIDELMARAGVSQRLVRQCEARGLIATDERAGAAGPRYTHEHICVLRFVRRAHALGFGMDEVARLLALWQDAHRASCDVKRIAVSRTEDLELQIEALQTKKRLLERLADLCLGDHQPACPILDELLALKGFACGPLSPSA